MPDKLWFLRRLNLFDGMTAEEVEAISHEFRMWRCDARQSMLDSATEHVYLLKEGRVRLYQVTADGHELTTAVVLPGQMFGVGALLGSGKATNAEALEESWICEAGAQDFLNMLARHPMLMAKVLMGMARHIFHLEEALESMAYKPVSARLATLLVSLLDQGARTPDGVVLPPYPQEEMGKMIGATRESVARALSEWREAGIIATGRRTVVREVDVLRRLATGDEARPVHNGTRFG
jgi:CRP/FNR family transcriptional regulator